MSDTKGLDVIDAWLKSRADGDWEHHNGVTIESTDNPGWMMRIDLPDDSSKHISNLNAVLSRLQKAEGLVKDGVLILYSTDLVSLVQGAACMIDDLRKWEAD
jgi:hypothetical protein